MQYIRICRILVIALTLALSATVLPTTPALAAAAIDLDPDEGKIGDEVTITGAGFAHSSTAAVYGATIYFAKDDVAVSKSIGTHVDTYEKVITAAA